MQPISAASKHTVAHENANIETRSKDEVAENLQVGNDNGSRMQSVSHTTGVRGVVGDVMKALSVGE